MIYFVLMFELLVGCALGETRGIKERVTVKGVNFPLEPKTAHSIELKNAFPNLNFEQPLLIAFPKTESSLLYVLEKKGVIRVFENTPKARRSKVFLDIRSKVSTRGNEEGLLGMAFHPKFKSNGLFYIYYSAFEKRRRISVIAEYGTRSPELANAQSERRLMTIRQPYSNHNGGMIEFGPDDLLYIGLGDGGSGGDPENYSQNRTELLGSILRIDPNVAGNRAYQIPEDNPFIGVRGARPEIYIYGMRNPWRFSFDPITGYLWIADVGQNKWEEVHYLTKGANGGWRLFEGDHNFRNPRNLTPEDYVRPVAEYGRELGVSITGGYVSQSGSLPQYKNWYFYGDFATGRIWALDFDRREKKTKEIQEVAKANFLISSFAQDQSGRLFAVDYTNGTIQELVEKKNQKSDRGEVPTRLSETGFFEDLKTLKVKEGIIEYDVNSPLWSDGASKRRWLMLPGEERIRYSDSGQWTFPEGTAVLKHFELDRRLETRVMFRHRSSWVGYTYKWNEEGTDAVLLTGRLDEEDWTYPSRQDCMRCHTNSFGPILGLRTGQLNKDFDYQLARDNQLLAWEHIDFFEEKINRDPKQLEKWPSPADKSVTVESRARSYLASNCANCHHPDSPTPDNMDLNWTARLDRGNVIGVEPSQGDLGIDGALRVLPGSPDRSVLLLRMKDKGEHQMPPLARRLVDPLGVNLITSWIESL